MNKALTETIKALRDLRHDRNASGLISHVVGFIGELIVLDKLKEEGVNAEHIGGRSWYDIKCGDSKIEVKTSKIREDDPWCDNVKYWGWGLRRKVQRNNLCSHVICVQLDEGFSAMGFQIIANANVEKFPQSKRYPTEANTLILPTDEDLDQMTTKAQDAFKPFVDVAKDYSKHIAPNESLSKSMGII
jgi:hypothetical protein